MAHGNDPSRPRELVRGNALEVVYEGCTAALACQPSSSSVGPGGEQHVVSGGGGVAQGEPVLGR